MRRPWRERFRCELVVTPAGTGVMSVRVGVTLPSFVTDPEIPLAVARAADATDLDAVFAYDHLFRDDGHGARRPAIECFTLLGAVAVETERIQLGTLVVRATLRPAAVTTNGLDTLQRISGGRVIATIGAGDSQSQAEMETFGLANGSVSERLAQLRTTVQSARGRGYPVWVGGHARLVGSIAADAADGWNRWGGTPAQFAGDRAQVLGQRSRESGADERFHTTWGGLVLVAESAAALAQKRARFSPGAHVICGTPELVAEQLHAWVAAGADWLICGPLDARDTQNAALLSEVRTRLRAA